MYERPYAMTKRLTTPSIDEAEQQVRDALAAQGFGVLTHIDVQSTFQAKLHITYRPYRILGACNPTLAHQALEADPSIGLFLPCNVIVFEGEDGAIWAQAIEPTAMFASINHPQVEPLAQDARARLSRALDTL